MTTGDETPPEPENAAEAGLRRPLGTHGPVDVGRMAASASSISTHNLMVESMWELDNIDRGRIANPIEYVQMRRRVGGAPWSANLVEYAAGAEVPDRYRRHPADAGAVRHVRRRRPPAQRPVLLPARGPGGRGELQRRAGLRAVLRLPDAGGRRAGQRPADLAAAAVRDHRARPRCRACWPSTPRPTPSRPRCRLRQGPAGLAVRRPGVARALQPVHERRRRAGPLAARGRPASAPRPRPTPGRTDACCASTPTAVSRRSGTCRCPRSACRSRSVPARTWTPRGATRSAGRATWASSTGARRRGGGVWDEGRFVGIDLAHCAAMIYADASPEQLKLSTDWLSWGTYGDDYYPLVFGAARDLPARQALQRPPARVHAAGRRRPVPEPAQRARTRPGGPVGAYGRADDRADARREFRGGGGPR